MVCLGGYWFWFFIRVDVAAEGNSPFRFVRADLFIVSLVLSTTFGLIWAWLQTAGNTVWATVFLGALSHRHDGAVRIGSVVEIFAHVLQAGRGVREKSIQSQRFGPELADADPRRSRTTEKTFHGAVAKSSDANGTWHQARSATPLLEDSSQVLLESA